MVTTGAGTPVTLTEVKTILKKVEKQRTELIYEQRIALEHAQKFARLTVKQAKDLVKELEALGFLDESQIYAIANILPAVEDDVRAVFAKERFSPTQEQIAQIIKIVRTYYIE
jgi:DNA-directed RNA polymerase subunit F